MTVELQLAKNLYNEEKKYMSKVENQKIFFFLIQWMSQLKLWLWGL